MAKPKFPTKAQIEKMERTNREIKNRGSNVKVTPQTTKEGKNKFNKLSSEKTKDAKSGKTAKTNAKEIEKLNKVAKEIGMTRQKIVEVNSNPVKGGATRIGPLASPRGGGFARKLIN